MGHRHKKQRTDIEPAKDIEFLQEEVPRMLVIVGAGNLLADLLAAIRESGNFQIAGIIDPAPGLRGQFVGGLPVLGWLGDIPAHATHAAIGNPATQKPFDRESVFRLLLRRNIAFPILAAASSRCASDVVLRRGTVLLPNAAVEAGAVLGENCLIGANAIVTRCAAVPGHYAVPSNTRFSESAPASIELADPMTLGATLASKDDSIQDIIQRMNHANMEIVFVVDSAGAVIGTITDGDIRRGILAGIDFSQPVSLIMNGKPVTVPLGTAHADMLRIMRRLSIRHLPVVDGERRPVRLERLENLVDSLTGQGAVVMAGGLGSRLRPLTNDTPKPLLPVAGRPILDHILDTLRASGIDDIVLSVNYLADRIRDHVGDGRNHRLNVAYVTERQRMGTAGALSLLRPRPHKPFLVMNGDLLTNMNFARLLEFQQQHDHTLVMCVRKHHTNIPYGVAEIRDGRVAALREKPVVEHFINAGIYVLKPACIDLVPPERYFDMPDLVNAVIESGGTVGAFPIFEYWRDIGNPQDLAAAARDHGRIAAPEPTAHAPVEALP